MFDSDNSSGSSEGFGGVLYRVAWPIGLFGLGFEKLRAKVENTEARKR